MICSSTAVEKKITKNSSSWPVVMGRERFPLRSAFLAAGRASCPRRALTRVRCSLVDRWTIGLTIDRIFCQVAPPHFAMQIISNRSGCSSEGFKASAEQCPDTIAREYDSHGHEEGSSIHKDRGDHTTLVAQRLALGLSTTHSL